MQSLGRLVGSLNGRFTTFYTAIINVLFSLAEDRLMIIPVRLLCREWRARPDLPLKTYRLW